MADPARTPNLKLQPIAANRHTWADIMNTNLRLIDSIVGSYFVIQNLQGVWENSTAYTVGESVVDVDSSVVYTVLESHVSSGIPTTFSEERATYTTRWGVYSSPARSRGVWLPSTSYALNDFVVDSGRYAICVQTHVSSETFDIDLALGYWSVLIDLSDAATAIIPVPGGASDANKLIVVNSNGTGYSLVTSSVALALLGVTSVGLGVLQAANAAAARAAIGAAADGAFQPLAPSLTALSAMVIGAFADDLLAGSSAAAVRTTLGITSIATLTPAAGINSFLQNPNSSNLRGALTDETGVGAAVFANSPVLTGTPTAPDQAEYDNSTNLATTAYADRTAKVLQIQIVPSNTYVASAGTATPFDDSVPTNTEGDEFLSITLTPKSASSRLFIEVFWNGSRAGADHITGSLFRDADTLALSANTAYFPSANFINQLHLMVDTASSAVASTTFALRVGSNTANPLYMNGTPSSRALGGQMRSFIRVTEYLTV